MINPAAIPQITGDMAALSGHATTISGVGTEFADTGSRVHTTWQGLAAVYDAPEAGQLFAATGPVKSVAESVGQDITAVGGALSAYAGEVTAIKARLEALRAQATTFVATVAADEDWRSDEGDVDRHNQLISDVDAAVADFMDAQRRCANTILARYCERRYTAENGDATITADEFGYTREMLDAAMGEDGALPWGTAEEHDRGFLGDVGAYFGGIGAGFMGMVEGLGALGGYGQGHWSWATAGAAWAGLGTFALAISVYVTPGGALLDQTLGYPGFERGKLGDTLTEAGKTLIAYDTWGEDNARAAGMTTFNIVAAVIGTKGGGGVLRGGGAALEASGVAAVAKVGAGMVRAGQFLAQLPTVDNVAGALARRIPGFRLQHVDLPEVDVPTAHVDTPRIDNPSPVHVPDGPSVGDAVAHTPDTPKIDVPHARVDADVPGGAGRTDTPTVGHTDATRPGGATDAPRSTGPDLPSGIRPDGPEAPGPRSDHTSPDQQAPHQPAADQLPVPRPDGDLPLGREPDAPPNAGDHPPVDSAPDRLLDAPPESVADGAPDHLADGPPLDITPGSPDPGVRWHARVGNNSPQQCPCRGE